MSINKKVIVTIAAGLVLSASSCRKYLDVNSNPNIATHATVQTLLPAGQLYVTSSMGVDMQIIGSMWCGYWTQSPNSSQYKAVETYDPGQDQFANAWENLYQANLNFNQLYKLADTQKKKHYKALALIMKAYTFQMITDGWGDAPFRQALKAQPDDGGILNPKYDSVSTIYNGVMAYVDSAEALLALTDANEPGTDDLIFHGDIAKWQRFGYTLKLRMLLRLSEKDPSAAHAGILALYATPGVAFLGNGEDAKIAFGSSTSNKNPLYAEASSTVLASTQNLVASSTAVDSLNSNLDDRAYVFYTYLSSGAVAGVRQGAYDITLPAGSFSIPNAYVGGDAQNSASATAPVIFMSASESYFLQAEVEARGWAATGMSDSVLWAQGIAQSFNLFSDDINETLGYDGATSYANYMAGGGYWTMYPTFGSSTDKLRYIITQKWFAMCGTQGFESWTELRRTGYPDFFLVSKFAKGGVAPNRFQYPTSESTRNSSFPGVQPVIAKVWWDIL